MTSPDSRLGALSRLPRDPETFYAVTDLATAKRVGGLLWLFGAVIVAVLLPVSPPTDELGSTAGWLLGIGIVVACVISSLPLLLAPERVTPRALVAMGYASLAMIALLEWAGGSHSPYAELYIISVIYFAAVHRPRQVALFMAAVVGCVALPFLYAGWQADHAALALVHVLLWCSLAAAAVLFTAHVRLSRIDLMEEEHVASQLARRDPLTGLGNRRAFDEALDRVVVGARRLDRPLTLVIADVQGFKSVNDRHGHLEGDRCLRAVGRALSTSVRPTDSCFRWGGDEFAVLLPATDAEQAQVAVGRIASAVAHDIAPPGGAPLRLRYGVAEIEPWMDAEALVAAADAELMASKGTHAQPAQ